MGKLACIRLKKPDRSTTQELSSTKRLGHEQRAHAQDHQHPCDQEEVKEVADHGPPPRLRDRWAVESGS